MKKVKHNGFVFTYSWRGECAERKFDVASLGFVEKVGDLFQRMGASSSTRVKSYLSVGWGGGGGKAYLEWEATKPLGIKEAVTRIGSCPGTYIEAEF